MARHVEREILTERKAARKRGKTERERERGKRKEKVANVVLASLPSLNRENNGLDLSCS